MLQFDLAIVPCGYYQSAPSQSMFEELPERRGTHAAGHDGLLYETRLLLAKHQLIQVHHTGGPPSVNPAGVSTWD